MSTPTPGKPRYSAIPTPGKSSGIPTPGRLRSTSAAAQYPPPSQDEEYISRAFADAIKANDPAQHRPTRTSDVSAASLSPSSAGYPPQSGRRSVVGRPSSVASSSSAVSSAASRTPAPSARAPARPASRQSDVFVRSSSRAGTAFEVGDSVRIESLGFEGTLGFLGEIDGKPGRWAGVELRGGFAGKGKNNGTVNGKRYFVCPNDCGVFVAATKLSLPTVGYLASSRPSSVASSRSGRITPSLSFSGRITPSSSRTFATGRKTPSVSTSNGRVTPSTSNGRVTPSASTGRRTPGIAPPTARSRATQLAKAVTPVHGVPMQSPITPGSRASKYVGMTARQLDSRGVGVSSPSQRSGGTSSPTRSNGLSSPSLYFGSPSRTSASPFNTPKAPSNGRMSSIGVGIPLTAPSKARPSLSTPRARIPSAIAMPPPTSPSTSSISGRSMSLNDSRDPGSAGSLTDLEMNGKALQDKIAELMSGKQSAISRPDFSVSMTSNGTAELQGQMDRLQARLDSLQHENQRLKGVAAVNEQETSGKIERLLTEQKQNFSRITELEALVRTTERSLNERETTIEALERAARQTAMDIDKIKNDADARVRDIQSKLEDKEAMVANMKEVVEAKEGLQTENDAVLRAKNAEISLLETRVQKAYLELEEERRELGGQVDELRKAGQETIALYEERLSGADSQRYELEDLITSLEEQVKAHARPPSPSAVAQYASSAAQIDNEELRDQVQHLQKKIGSLEDQLEESRMVSEREEIAMRDKVRRYKEREEGIRKELIEGRKEVERLMKLEEAARQRIEEIEEALRENKVALENARAEIEGLRNDIPDLDGIPVGGARNGSSDRLAERANEHSRLAEEVVQLKHQLAEAHAHSGSSGDIHSNPSPLADQLLALQSEKAALQQLCKDRSNELERERKAATDLRLLVEERSTELETMRKKLNRDMPVNGLDTGKLQSPSSKHDLAVAREEITGLKHIVQELQKENSATGQRTKVLESENKLLLSETEQLREDLKVLEDNIEQSIMREEQVLASGDVLALASGDAATAQRGLKEVRAKYETELEQLRKKQMESEMKSARTIHDLNKEIGELETLIESKIYREDELERELERLKEKAARSQKKSSKTDLPEDPGRRSGGSRTEPVRSEEVCEICERPGHDIFTCDLLREEAAPLQMKASHVSSGTDLYCEDCEESGHVAANCPHSQDVF